MYLRATTAEETLLEQCIHALRATAGMLRSPPMPHSVSRRLVDAPHERRRKRERSPQEWVRIHKANADARLKANIETHI